MALLPEGVGASGSVDCCWPALPGVAEGMTGVLTAFEFFLARGSFFFLPTSAAADLGVFGSKAGEPLGPPDLPACCCCCCCKLLAWVRGLGLEVDPGCEGFEPTICEAVRIMPGRWLGVPN